MDDFLTTMAAMVSNPAMASSLCASPTAHSRANGHAGHSSPKHREGAQSELVASLHSGMLVTQGAWSFSARCRKHCFATEGCCRLPMPPTVSEFIIAVSSTSGSKYPVLRCP